jgi:conjugative transfer signal peptidase TraF
MNRRLIAACTTLGVAAVAIPPIAGQPAVRIVYNASESVPSGWYRIAPGGALRVGSIVLAELPATAAALAAQRGYLPTGVPLLKRIGAMAPQSVCVTGGMVRIDGTVVARTHAVDSRGRTLPAWQRCRRLRVGELFVLSTTHPASFDSRYFGPIDAASVLGVAHPLWTSEAR